MRKHNTKFATRFGRGNDGDRTNFPQTMAHRIVNNVHFQLGANTLLRNLLSRAGV